MADPTRPTVDDLKTGIAAKEARPPTAHRVAAGEAARDDGMARVEAGSDPRVILAIDAVIERAISSGRRFSANTIRDQLPVSDSHLVGARVHSYALRRVDGHPLMVCVGREPSTLLSTKSAEVKVWLGYDAHQTIHRAAHAAS
ncbi:MAG: hypothetical protein H6515_14775 [Microthrixaceae bacterium]|jgi:hypothetical protein|nr:hypothetical protein [Microthrixaceae bacterium]